MSFNRANVITLSHEVKIIVPSTVSVNVAVNSSGMVDYVAAELSRINGGATIYAASGAWNSDTEGLVKESVSVVASSCAELTPEVLESVYTIGYKILTDMSQEAVSVYIDGTLYLILPD